MDETLYYGNAAGFRAYFTTRGKAVPDNWADAAITAALQVASEYIDGTYVNQFAGLKIGQRAQIREWPRNGAVDWYGYPIALDEIPREAINATYEAAYRQMTTPGSLSPDFLPNKYRSASVSGAVAVTYAAFVYAWQQNTQFQDIERAIQPILTDLSGNFSSLSGASSRV